MTLTLAAIVIHFGAAVPTIRVANCAVAYADRVLVIANDLTPRPSGLASSVDWVIPPRNLGYAFAATYALPKITEDVAVLLNNDIVLSRETVTACLAEFEEEGVAVVGPVLRHVDGSLQSGAAHLTRVLGAPRTLIDPGPTSVDCDWVTGAILFTSVSVLVALGMDGGYFLGREDVDYCWRVREAGLRVRCVGGVPAVHQGAGVLTGARWSYYYVRNSAWFADEHLGRGRGILVRAWLAVLLGRVLLADILKGRSLLRSRLHARGLRDSLRRKPPLGQPPWACEPVPSRFMEW